jgi:hypothetical protein
MHLSSPTGRTAEQPFGTAPLSMQTKRGRRSRSGAAAGDAFRREAPLAAAGQGKPPRRCASRCTQSRRRPRIRATCALFSSPISPPEVRAAAHSNVTSSDEPPTAIRTLLSATPRRRPPARHPRPPRLPPARTPGAPMWQTRIGGCVGLAHRIAKTPLQNAQIPAGSARSDLARSAFALQISVSSVTRDALCKQEVTGSIPVGSMVAVAGNRGFSGPGLRRHPTRVQEWGQAGTKQLGTRLMLHGEERAPWSPVPTPSASSIARGLRTGESIALDLRPALVKGAGLLEDAIGHLVDSAAARR